MRDRSSWVDALPDDLAPQRRLLGELLRWCEQEPDVRWLVVGCSLARGSADWMSDLDCAIGVTAGGVQQAVQGVLAAVGDFGDLVECFDHRMVGGAAHARVFAQYRDRTQIDLVVVEAWDSTVPGTVVLYDADDRCVTEPPEPSSPVTPGVRVWSCQAWEALVNVGKYLRRGSTWEAHGQLEEARAHLWQLWAVAEKAARPQYGLTSLLDISGGVLPQGIEDTVVRLDATALLRAALQLSSMLVEVQGRLRAVAPYRLPDAFAHFVVNDLETLASSLSG